MLSVIRSLLCNCSKCFDLLILIVVLLALSVFIFKINERSEDSYIGLADFFFQEKVLKCALKSLITTDGHSYILMHLWMHIGIYAFFEFT